MCGSAIEFYEGERKEITVTVRSKNRNETVIVTSAEFEVKKYYTENQIVQNGILEFSGDEAKILIELTEKGVYELKVTIEAGREKRIEKTAIKVK